MTTTTTTTSSTAGTISTASTTDTTTRAGSVVLAPLLPFRLALPLAYAFAVGCVHLEASVIGRKTPAATTGIGLAIPIQLVEAAGGANLRTDSVRGETGARTVVLAPLPFPLLSPLAFAFALALAEALLRLISSTESFGRCANGQSSPFLQSPLRNARQWAWRGSVVLAPLFPLP